MDLLVYLHYIVGPCPLATIFTGFDGKPTSNTNKVPHLQVIISICEVPNFQLLEACQIDDSS